MSSKNLWELFIYCLFYLRHLWNNLSMPNTLSYIVIYCNKNLILCIKINILKQTRSKMKSFDIFFGWIVE